LISTHSFDRYFAKFGLPAPPPPPTHYSEDVVDELEPMVGSGDNTKKKNKYEGDGKGKCKCCCIL
jgi:hypothetical protein